MSQITTGIRSILSLPAMYDLVQNLVGAQKNRLEFVRRYVQPKEGDVLLDVGCGTGDILEALPAVAYYGCDISQEYIDKARERYGTRGTFMCERLSASLIQTLPPLDRVIMHGVLHHMSDAEVIDVMKLARSGMRSGARFVSIDPCFTVEQSPIARFLISRDRGQCVRTPDAYRALAAQVFPRVDVAVRHDLNRIPYSHAILTCGD